MFKVFKYPVPMVDEFDMDLPSGAKILKVECQRNEPFMWCLVNPEKRVFEKRKFRLAGTGHEINQYYNKINHISTFQMADGALIWHIFEVF